MWKRIIHGLTLTTAPSSHHGKVSRILHWRGTIRLDGGGGGTVIVPFEGRYDYKRIKAVRGTRHVERQHEYVERCSKAPPTTKQDCPRPTPTGSGSHGCWAPTQTIRSSSATTTDRRRRDRIAAHERGETSAALPDGHEAFLSAVRRVHVEDRSARPWRKKISVQATAFYELAAADGRVTVDQVVHR